MTEAIIVSGGVGLAALDKAIEADAKLLQREVSKAVETAWRLGRRLLTRRTKTPHGQWTSYLRSVGIHDRNARIYMQLARQIGSAADLGPSIRATLDEIGASERAAREADRAARDERLAVRLESCPDGVEPVAHLQAMLDKANRVHDENVALGAKYNRQAEAEERKFLDIGDALRAAKRCGSGAAREKAIDGILMRFFGVARPAA